MQTLKSYNCKECIAEFTNKDQCNTHKLENEYNVHIGKAITVGKGSEATTKTYLEDGSQTENPTEDK